MTKPSKNTGETCFACKKPIKRGQLAVTVRGKGHRHHECPSKPRDMVKHRKLTDIRDPNVVWYGPHPCVKCGKTVIKTASEGPHLTLDAEDHNHNYPNFLWQEHVCKS